MSPAWISNSTVPATLWPAKRGVSTGYEEYLSFPFPPPHELFERLATCLSYRVEQSNSTRDVATTVVPFCLHPPPCLLPPRAYACMFAMQYPEKNPRNQTGNGY
jgi:hypothetical protein